MRGLAVRIGVGMAVLPALAFVGLLSPALAKPVPSHRDKARKPPVKAPNPADLMTNPVLQLKSWVSATGDNRDKPFMVIDKIAARVFVFDKEGKLLGAAPALIGSALGDEAVAGVGDRELADIEPADRTTPAGRFVSGFGRASGNRQVLWIDYTTSISLHPVVTRIKQQRRPQRLQSSTPEDNRITFGCINVSAPFYHKVVSRHFRRLNSIVYILPDTRSMQEVFPSFRAVAHLDPRLED